MEREVEGERERGRAGEGERERESGRGRKEEERERERGSQIVIRTLDTRTNKGGLTNAGAEKHCAEQNDVVLNNH